MIFAKLHHHKVSTLLNLVVLMDQEIKFNVFNNERKLCVVRSPQELNPCYKKQTVKPGGSSILSRVGPIVHVEFKIAQNIGSREKCIWRL